VVLPRPGPLQEDLAAIGVRTTVIPLNTWVCGDHSRLPPGGRLGLNLLASVFSGWKAYRWSADVIGTNSSVTPAGALAALLVRKPDVWHVREFVSRDYRWSFDMGERLTKRLMGRLSRRLVLVSEALKESYSKYVPRRKLVVIYDAVSSPTGVRVEGAPGEQYRKEPRPRRRVPTL
jgi:hypothetical protein